jgi:endonuclease/exonuclease/phosphatase family metal-dependent hydrolase
MVHKLVNGVQVELTAAEVTAMEEQAVAWEAGAFDRAMANLRQKRNALLSATDYLALSDNTLSSDMSTYRAALRDLTEDLTTVDEVEAVEFPTKP